MKKTEQIVQRGKDRLRFRNGDMDFLFGWVIGLSQVMGMSASQAFLAVASCRDGDPGGWREGFRAQAERLTGLARQQEEAGERIIAGQSQLGAASAFRAALHFVDPAGADFLPLVRGMERSFQAGAGLLGIPLSPIEVPFEGKSLSGYVIRSGRGMTGREAPPLLVMVGGGDTFREDLFPIAGYPGWKRGWDVLMVDLPGQGMMPNRGFTFRADMAQPISAVLDWADVELGSRGGRTAIYGVSGGGYFTAQAVAVEPRINAWVASTPIHDMARVFRQEFGAVMKAPGWLAAALMRIAGTVNEGAEIAMRKYGWQFGTPDLRSAMEEIQRQAKPVSIPALRCPALFLVGESEAADLKRQAAELYDVMKAAGSDVTLRTFSAAEGGDAHCQVNNLRLAHLVVFDWLDRVLGLGREREARDTRLIC